MLFTKIASFSDTKGCSCSFLLRNYHYRGRMLSRFAAFTGGRCEKNMHKTFGRTKNISTFVIEKR